jgi:hypothetical protein
MKRIFTRVQMIAGSAAAALLTVCLLQVPAAYGATTPDTKDVKIGVGLDDRNVTKDQLSREIKQQLSKRGVSASEKEVQAAVTNALDLIGKSKDPQKGVIHVKTKKFTLCVAWGSDKGACK